VTPINFVGNKLWSFRTTLAARGSHPAKPDSATS
jgi:hypothetical protein